MFNLTAKQENLGLKNNEISFFIQINKKRLKTVLKWVLKKGILSCHW